MFSCQAAAALSSTVKSCVCVYVRVRVCARGGSWQAISDCVSHSWNEMFAQKPGQQDRSMSHCDGPLDTIRQNGKASIYCKPRRWTAWIIHVDGIEWRLCAFIPCCPQRALPLAVKVGGTHARTHTHKEKQTETGVSAIGVSVQVTSSVSSHRNTSDLSSQSRNEIKQDELRQTQFWVRSKVN